MKQIRLKETTVFIERCEDCPFCHLDTYEAYYPFDATCGASDYATRPISFPEDGIAKECPLEETL